MRNALRGILFTGLLCTGQAFAQCTLQMSFNECIGEGADNEEQTAVGAAALDLHQKQLAATNTGPVDGAASPVSTALTDFASKIRLGLDAADFGDDGNQGLSFDWSGIIRNLVLASFPEDGVRKWASDDHKLSLTLHDPELFASLGALLTDDQRADAVAELGDGDDIGLAFSWSPVDRRRGRRISEHAEVFGTAFGAVWNEVSGDFNQAETVMMAQLGVIFPLMPASERNRIEATAESVPLQQLVDECESESRSVCQAAMRAALPLLDDINERFSTEQLETALEARLNSGPYLVLQKLVNNQPQWVVAAKARKRDELAGRDEMSLKLTYELGLVNMQDLYDSGTDCAQTLSCIQDFLAANADTVDNGNRVAFSLELQRQDSYEFVRAGLPSLSLDGESSVIMSLSYGRSLDSNRFLGSMALLENEPGRIDVGLSYEDVDNDPMRNNRLLFNAAFTQEIADGAVLSLGFVYANEPEYRGAVDEEISARFGVNYKLGQSDR